jgi:AcrR family transcriptional regulator
MTIVTSTPPASSASGGTDHATSPGRGRPRSAECDAAIVEATLSILAEDGYGALTMAGVAHRAGVSTATLYRRWASKEDLVIGALEGMAELKRHNLPDTGTLRGDLTQLLTQMAENLTGQGGRLMEGLLSETLRNRELAETLRRRFTQPRRAELASILERAVERGEIPPVADVGVALSLITGPLYERLLVTGEPVNRQVVRQVVDLLTQAFGGAGDAARRARH